MARSNRTSAARGAAIRDELVADKRRLVETFPTAAGRATLAALEAGEPIEVTGRALWSALHRLDPYAARPLTFKHNRNRRRRFLLDADNTLTEITEGAPN